MSIIDKATGALKRTLGNVSGDPALRREGRAEEMKGEKKEELSRKEREADRKAREIADLERQTRR